MYPAHVLYAKRAWRSGTWVLSLVPSNVPRQQERGEDTGGQAEKEQSPPAPAGDFRRRLQRELLGCPGVQGHRLRGGTG